MSLDPTRPRSISPESSGRDSPVPKQWRNQLGNDDVAPKDKNYRKYASGVERALSLFDTALQEWADYISFLNRLLKALQARPSTINIIPAKATVAKRLSQCLNPSLPSGVHQKTLEVYNFIFTVIGKDGLSRDLPLYLPGLASVLSFASLSVRTPFLDLLERHFLDLNPRSLRPALKSIILALLPGLEEETSEDFERTLKLMERVKAALRPPGSEIITLTHSSGDDFFWQCFFLASITGHSRRTGALAYLMRALPELGHQLHSEGLKTETRNGLDSEVSAKLVQLVTSPEPGLLIRCFAAGLADDQILIQRGFLDLLVTHLPLHSKVLQARAKTDDLELLLKTAVGVTTRRDMSLNRRLWTWLLGPEPTTAHEGEGGPDSPTTPASTPAYFMSRTSYFEEFGLRPLTRALLSMIKASSVGNNPADRAKPYRICLSLMDRWEIGGLVVPEVFLPIVDSVRDFKAKAESKSDFTEVIRSASVFFDGVESGLIYSEMLNLVAQAISPGELSVTDRSDKLDLVRFILGHFNVSEEEMITIHAPLTVLSILCMIEELKESDANATTLLPDGTTLLVQALTIAASFLELVPERAFPTSAKAKAIESKILAGIPNVELLKKIKNFYHAEQGNLEATSPPFVPQNVAELLLQKACDLNCESFSQRESGPTVAAKSKVLLLLLTKTPHKSFLDTKKLLASIHGCLSSDALITFTTYYSLLTLSTHLYSADRISHVDLSELVSPLVRHAWSFLSSSEPKYHVETVRSLWVLQTALTPTNHDIEAAICSLMLEKDVSGTFAQRPADPGRSFCVLWSHSLQDNPAGSDRRGPKTPIIDAKAPPRLGGIDNYEVMLTRPLFLMLDALTDERTQLFMTVKSWLSSLVGIDKIFNIFVSKFAELSCLRRQTTSAEAKEVHKFSEDDDVELAVYYLRSLSNVFRFTPDSIWAFLAKKTIRPDSYFPSLSEITGSEDDLTFQEFFLKVAMQCMADVNTLGDESSQMRVTQLYRSALGVMNPVMVNPYAEPLAKLHLENPLIDMLTQSLSGPEPYVQTLLLDVVFAALKLRELAPVELPESPTAEKRAASVTADSAKAFRAVAGGKPPSALQPPPPTLLKCILSGLSAPSSRQVLDSWISFLAECLPLYSDSIFQVLIPLVETLCSQISTTFNRLQQLFRASNDPPTHNQIGPETTLISLLNGLEQVLARGHDRLLAEEARAQVVKNPDQPQGFFGNMVSGVFSSDAPQTRSATANDRLTVLLAFQDAVRICFTIWSWGQGSDASLQDNSSGASFNYTSLRMRNRARRLLEHLFAAETLECLETVIGIWRGALDSSDTSKAAEVFNLLPALDGSRPQHTIPALFNAIYSRTNPGALDPSRRSTLTIELQDTDVVIFLVDYARTLEDDAMDEIWQDCMIFLKDLLGNPLPHRQALPSLLEFAAILGEKVDNTNFGEQRKMRRELADLFLRLLAAIFTTRPTSFVETSSTSYSSSTTNLLLSEKKPNEAPRTVSVAAIRTPFERADDVVGILSNIVPNLPKILVENDRILTAATSISANVIGPTLRSKFFPDTVSKNTLVLLHQLSRLPNNQKSWKKDVADAFNDSRFFSSNLSLVQTDWLPLLKQWAVADKERIPEILGRITPPSTAGIVFGVGATSARLEADRKTQLNLRRIATLILAATDDNFVTELPSILDKLVELLGATATSSPSSTTRAEVYMVMRALVLRTSAIHLAPLWPVVNAELHAAISSVVAPDHSAPSDTYGNPAVMQACKLLDLLVCVAPDDFQLHEWLFVTDTIDAVYRPSAAGYQPVALVDEVSEELNGSLVTPHAHHSHTNSLSGAGAAALGLDPSSLLSPTDGIDGQGQPLRRPLLGNLPGQISDEVGMERKDELVAKVLRPFFGQLSIFAFETTYKMTEVDWEGCVNGLLRDLFDERSVVKAL
ncbi:Dopey, N-terminal-domain-containing protein [Neurospora tetraspora]|uniref:Dopey, N-terminal-domain-containing protein n=1 Tax=Neurospora tetraspora TaxID=94610 RepID=A0AAE0JQI9_9PEZI|nr:Dopey, N-terminal-domain-containing protein [Neurospora tetraspora]